MKHIYYAYGLKIESEFNLPELQIIKDNSKPDVTIKNLLRRLCVSTTLKSYPQICPSYNFL